MKIFFLYPKNQRYFKKAMKKYLIFLIYLSGEWHWMIHMLHELSKTYILSSAPIY